MKRAIFKDWNELVKSLPEDLDESAKEPLLDKLAFFIFRVTYTNLPLVNLDGFRFDILTWLKGIDESSNYSEITVVSKDDGQKRLLFPILSF